MPTASKNWRMRWPRSLRKYNRLAPEFYARVVSAREVIDFTATHGGGDAPTPPAPQP